MTVGDRDGYLDSLHTRDDIDLRGTTFGPELLELLLSSMCDAIDNVCRIGNADFSEAYFLEQCDFSDVIFTQSVNFSQAWLENPNFTRTEFSGVASFIAATFPTGAFFGEGIFRDRVEFNNAKFTQDMLFIECAIAEGASFWDATFGGQVSFARTVARRLDFTRSQFNAHTGQLGPFYCPGSASFRQAVFARPVEIDAMATYVYFHGTRWESAATIRLRHAQVSLDNATLTQPVSIKSHPTHFADFDASIDWPVKRAQLTSLRGVDCSFLSLGDVDLSQCQLSGAFHLDLIRLEGHSTFAIPPAGWKLRIGFPFNWTRRQVIDEERQWRALPSHSAALRRGWGDPPENEHDIPGLAALTVIYRQLRKAREDAKDEPGAADFYYGEMEMRRHSHTWRQAERWLLQAYWLLSGYGLRASRALGWLATAMLTTIVLMMGFGLPNDPPKQTATGTVPADGGKVAFKFDKEDPRNPTGDRFTGKRFEKALNVTLNSVIFRASGQDLTTAGTYIEMVSRLAEPVLLGFAGLAVRGRVKRGS
ncbi:pentapeptide repeat-containing protein [Streptomyces sp. NBC_01456]|uniref:pentapeptide repeat-containing protein n=1 Tax=unclassified Streptomyces TaxID=2593676 RepID=UPI002E35BC5D|nr:MULTISPECIES: pentapeptide repeat-containing protein [unclassified Streptomyces]